jgi:protein-export membrane protein SecD
VTQRSVEIIERRLQGLDADVAEHSPGRLIIRTRASTVPPAVRERLAPQGKLTFNLVRDDTQGNLPVGTMLAQPMFEGGHAEIVNERAEFTGERLVRANPSTEPQTGQFVLSFGLDAEGTRLFCRITRDHIGQRFAILLDGKVITAPTINEPICGGSGQISGNFTAQSANELAILLRAGALPAPFHIVEELPPAP